MPPFSSKKTAPPVLTRAAGPVTIMDDEEFAEFSQRQTRAQGWQARLVSAELKLRQAGQRPIPVEALTADQAHKRADALRLNPPQVSTPTPTTMSGILIERMIVERALILLEAEGRKHFTRAFNMVMEKRRPEYDAICRAYALAVAEAVELENNRNALAGQIAFGLFGRQGLPLDSCKLCNGRQGVESIFESALKAGYLKEGEFPSVLR